MTSMLSALRIPPSNPPALSEPIQGKQWPLLIGWWLFVAAFFIAWDKHALRATFNLGVVLPALICALPLLRQIRWRDPLWLSFIATLLFLGASSLWGADAASGQPLKALKVALFLLALFCVPNYLARTQALQLARMTPLLLVLAAAFALASIGAFVYPLLATGISISADNLLRLGGLGQQANPLLFAGTMGCCGAVALALYYRVTETAHIIALLALANLFALALALTLSRGPLFYFAAISAGIIAMHPRQWRRSLLLLALPALLLVAFALSDYAQNLANANFARPIFRSAIWSTIVEETRGHALIGQGWRKDESLQIDAGTMGHSHNFLIGTYRFAGLIGLALFATLLGALLYRCSRLPSATALPLGAWLLFGIGLELSNGRFPLSAPSSDWFFFWLPAAFIHACGNPATGNNPLNCRQGSAEHPG